MHNEIAWWTSVFRKEYPLCAQHDCVGHKRVTRQFLDAWSSMVLLAGGNLDYTVKGRGNHIQEIVSWISKISWAIVTNCEGFMTRAKSFAHSCRLSWITKCDDPRIIRHSRTFWPGWLKCRHSVDHKGYQRALLQKSFLARALPMPGQNAIREAIAPMIQRVTSSFDVSPLKEHVIERIVRGKRPRLERRVPLQSPGSCFQNSRLNGGRRKYYAGRLQNFLEEQTKTDLVYDNHESFAKRWENPSGVKESRRILFLREHIWNSTDYVMDSTPVAIAERGWKVRVVSRSCALRVAHSEGYREGFRAMLMHRRAFRLPQMGLTDFLPLHEGGRSNKFVFSADLSAATDLISRELLESLSSFLGIDPALVCGGRIQVNKFDFANMTRGTLMGIPLSFPMLNLIHLYVCESIGARRDTYYICGDDLIALWSISLIRKYKHALLKLTGMLLNDTKSFISKSRGIFCEKAFHLAKDGLRVNRQFLSVKAVTPLGRSLPPKGAEAHPEQPWEMAPLLYLNTHIARLGHSRAHFAQQSCLRDYCKRLAYLARKHRVSQYLPLHLGGAGIIPPKANMRLSQNEEAWLRALETGDAVAASRLRMARTGTTKSYIFDSRGHRRTSQVTKHIVYSKSGSGLTPKILGLIGRYREFNDDLSAAEGRDIPEDISPKLYFKALGAWDYKGDRPPLVFRRYVDTYRLTLLEDTSKFGVADMLKLIKRTLPDPVLLDVLLNEQDERELQRSEDEFLI
ncbi:RNA-dependent RNA polymerase [Botrytis cinerea narnavirus 4]|nr:RNA-dependent RNA polymerase [Botrytis cinerea narnavirus 4]